MEPVGILSSQPVHSSNPARILDLLMRSKVSKSVYETHMIKAVHGG